MNVIKTSNQKVPYDAEKIHDKTLLAVQGLSNVSASEVEMNAGLSLRNNIRTSEIQENLISSAAELIDEEHPNYEIVAARLLNQKIRKEVYKQYTPLTFIDEVKKRVQRGIYDSLIFKKYTDVEIQYFGSKIRYNRDDSFTYTGLSQMYNVYTIKRRNKAIETPQESFMLMMMYVFSDYKDKELRKKWILEGYTALSTFEISLPTPIMNGLRTIFKRFISCNLIDAGDTTKSLALANAFIMMMTANKSGLGLNTGDVRGLGADIDDGRMEHTGILPILKAYEKSTSAFTQIGRGGSSTNHYPFFHYEIDLIMQLGNAKGTEDTRVRHADHSIIFNKTFMKRLINNDNITLFHMNEVPGLYEAIGTSEFESMYEEYERTVKKKHKLSIPASEFAEKFINERFLQGRLYYLFADNAHEQGPWNIPVYVSNLCLTGDVKVSIKIHDKTKEVTMKELNELYNTSKNIEVLSNNLLGEQEYKKILASAMTNSSAKVLKITDAKTGKFIKCTSEHKVYTKNRGYIEAQYLNSIDDLEIRDTTSSTLTIEYIDEEYEVYDITVEDNHNFYANDILVHNCQEILVPIKPLDQADAEVGVCILGGVNHGHTSDERVPVVAELLVRFLDAMIDYMDYSHDEIENPAKKRRTLGIGHSDVFHYLAKNKVFYNTTEGRNLLHERLELTAFHLHKASIQLAKEFGACEWIDDTKYNSGWFPIDSCNKNVHELTTCGYKQDWESLRKEQQRYGQRNSTLTANAPYGNSAKPSNSTSGIEPPRFLATQKEDKIIITQLVPEYAKYKNWYTTAWSDDFNNVDYFKMVAIVQKFTDQSISTNQYTNLLKYEDGKVPYSVLLDEFLTAYKYGHKTGYYENFRTSDDVDGLSEEPQGCAGGGCIV